MKSTKLFRPGDRVEILRCGWNWGPKTGVVLHTKEHRFPNSYSGIYYIVAHHDDGPEQPFDHLASCYSFMLQLMVERIDKSNDYAFDAQMREEGLAWFREGDLRHTNLLDRLAGV